MPKSTRSEVAALLKIFADGMRTFGQHQGAAHLVLPSGGTVAEFSRTREKLHRALATCEYRTGKRQIQCAFELIDALERELDVQTDLLRIQDGHRQDWRKIEALGDQLAELAETIASTVDGAAVSDVSRALALIVEYPKWSVRRFAEEVGVHSSTLYKWPEVGMALKARRSTRTLGRRLSDGSLEGR